VSRGECSWIEKEQAMGKKSLLLFGVVCMSLFFAQPARAFLGLAIRVGMFYTTYKFVDGIADSGVSNFVDKYADGPIDAICSFGEGVKRFGLGVRNAVVTFSSTTSDAAFSKSWDVLKHDWEASIDTTKSVWKERRVKSLAKKEKITRGAAHAIG
jgi:hypothetical protein